MTCRKKRNSQATCPKFINASAKKWFVKVNTAMARPKEPKATARSFMAPCVCMALLCVPFAVITILCRQQPTGRGAPAWCQLARFPLRCGLPPKLDERERERAEREQAGASARWPVFAFQFAGAPATETAGLVESRAKARNMLGLEERLRERVSYQDAFPSGVAASVDPHAVVARWRDEYASKRPGWEATWEAHCCQYPAAAQARSSFF